MGNKNTAQKILIHPITRAIPGLLACLIVFIAAQNAAGKLLMLTGTGQDLRNLIKGVFASATVIITYRRSFNGLRNGRPLKFSLKTF